MNLPSKTLRICFSGDDYVRTATCRSSPRAVSLTLYRDTFQLAKDSNLRARMGQAGHRLVKKAHNIAELNARLVEIYEEARSLYMSSRSKRA
jgi:hypothetical protein